MGLQKYMICTQHFRSTFVALKRDGGGGGSVSGSPSVCVCFCIHKLGPLVSGLLNQDQVACHIPLFCLSLTRSSPLQAETLLCKQVRQSSSKRVDQTPPPSKKNPKQKLSTQSRQALLFSSKCYLTEGLVKLIKPWNIW